MKKIILLFVLVVAGAMRLWSLEAVPGGFFVDEASIGYNAYSLLETGKDEYGISWPLSIKSFGDYKNPVYSYILMGVYRVVGMGVATTRGVSAVAGVVGVLLIYLLIWEIGGNEVWGLMTAGVLAIAPWSLMMSRQTIEANLALTFMLAGWWLFYKARKNGGWLVVSVIMMVLSIYTYHSEKVIVPVLMGYLWWNNYKKIDKKWSFVAVVVGGVMVLPMVAGVLSGELLSRAAGVNIFHNGLQGWNLFRKWAELYTAYFSPKHIFYLGDSVVRNTYVDVGPIWWAWLPLAVWGVISLIGRGGEAARLVLVLVLVSALPASLVGEPFGSIRSLTMVVPIVIIVGLGMKELLKNKWGKLVVVSLWLAAWGRSYLSVFKVSDYYRASAWDYGVRQVVELTKKEKEVVIDNWRNEIYAPILFFSKYDPVEYQKRNTGLSWVKNVDNMTVRHVDWEKEVGEGKLLVLNQKMLAPWQVKEKCLNKLWTVDLPSGEVAWWGIRGKIRCD